mgnify:FL=1
MHHLNNLAIHSYDVVTANGPGGVPEYIYAVINRWAGGIVHNQQVNVGIFAGRGIQGWDEWDIQRRNLRTGSRCARP